MKYNLEIQNLVFKVNLKVKLPLEIISVRLENAEYNPRHFPGLVFRPPEYKNLSIIMFKSGRLVVTGLKSVDEIHPIVNYLWRELFKINVRFDKSKVDIGITNLVASANLGHELKIDRIAYKLGGCQYDPDQFPGLILRSEKPKRVFLLFTSGKVICTGFTEIDALESAIDTLIEKLREINEFN